MNKSNIDRTNEFLRQLEIVERRHAARVMRELIEPPFATKVKDFRQKYIVSGFLYPLYSWDKRYSRPLHRIERLGDFVQSREMAGELFGERGREWVVQEEYWFSEYLIYGQNAILAYPSHQPPSAHIIEGALARIAWQQIYSLLKKLNLHGLAGGGIYSSREYLEEEYLASGASSRGGHSNSACTKEAEIASVEPRWLELMKDYRNIKVPIPFPEMRPAWFHLANYVLFGIPITRLSVFSIEFNHSGNVSQLTFLDDSLTGETRKVIGKLCLRLPDLMQNTKASSTNLLQRNMKWWAWNKIGDRKGKRHGYGEIAKLSKYTKTNIQANIGTIDRTIRRGITNDLLAQLMHVTTCIGLEPNLVYDYLVEENLVPHRERPIDGFDDLTRLL